MISQLVPIPNSVHAIPGRKSNATYELVFLASLPPLGYKSYIIKRTGSAKQEAMEEISIGNKVYDYKIYC